MDMVGRDDATKTVVTEGVGVGAVTQGMGALSTVDRRAHPSQ